MLHRHDKSIAVSTMRGKSSTGEECQVADRVAGSADLTATCRNHLRVKASGHVADLRHISSLRVLFGLPASHLPCLANPLAIPAFTLPTTRPGTPIRVLDLGMVVDPAVTLADAGCDARWNGVPSEVVRTRRFESLEVEV